MQGRSRDQDTRRWLDKVKRMSNPVLFRQTHEQNRQRRGE